MSDKPKGIDWTIERIRLLSDVELKSLRENAIKRGNMEIVRRCDQVEAERKSARARTRKTNRIVAAGAGLPRSFSIPENAIDAVTGIILTLPHALSVPNGVTRLALQQSPTKTLSELWRQFVICGFSSQENSEEGGALSSFVAANGPLLDLAQVCANRCDSAWVTREVRTHLSRQLRNKVGLVLGAYPHFVEAGAPGDLLADLCRRAGALKVFCDLARGDIDDHDVAMSATFSQSLDHSAFPYIGNKQIRNILVNSGLAHNVVPLDSRWQNFFGNIMVTNSATFQNTERYLAVENVLRSALVRVHTERSDIENLAVLDAVVFSYMSKKGIGPGGWLGLGPI
ncbi:hypothetical protein P3T20_004066 [Paraburkholderia sp. GAS206C]|uniref:hypothetical protein n=1 Tax=unclassified Paraburkholderia TaxID=2615204 RepID=UPI003D218639